MFWFLFHRLLSHLLKLHISLWPKLFTSLKSELIFCFRKVAVFRFRNHLTILTALNTVTVRQVQNCTRVVISRRHNLDICDHSRWFCGAENDPFRTYMLAFTVNYIYVHSCVNIPGNAVKSCSVKRYDGLLVTLITAILSVIIVPVDASTWC